MTCRVSLPVCRCRSSGCSWPGCPPSGTCRRSWCRAPCRTPGTRGSTTRRRPSRSACPSPCRRCWSARCSRGPRRRRRTPTPDGSFSSIVPGMAIRVTTSPPEVATDLAGRLCFRGGAVAALPSTFDGFMPLAPVFQAVRSIVLAAPVPVRPVGPAASSSGCRAASPRSYVSGAEPLLVSVSEPTPFWSAPSSASRPSAFRPAVPWSDARRSWRFGRACRGRRGTPRSCSSARRRHGVVADRKLAMHDAGPVGRDGLDEPGLVVKKTLAPATGSPSFWSTTVASRYPKSGMS